MEDLVLDDETDEWVSTGRSQVHIAGTRKAFTELGTMLLALANYTPPESNYTMSLELNDREGQPCTHFVFHLPIDDMNNKPKLWKIQNIATGIFDKNGLVADTTLKGIKKSDDESDSEE